MLIAHLSQVLAGIVDVPDHHADLQLTGLSLDSRSVKSGDLFFAVQGTQKDGRQFIQEALKKGAIAVLAEGEAPSSPDPKAPIFYIDDLKNKLGPIAARFYDHPAKALQIIGVTGTSGKTSCTQLIAAALQKANIACGTIGTLGWGLIDQLVPTHLTTPDAIFLQETFRTLHQQGATHVAMEVSSHSLEQGRVADVPFKIGIFTNLSHEHLDYHGTMEAYGAAKKKLFDCPHLEQAIINSDDPFGQHLITTLPPGRPLYVYGLEKWGTCPSVYVKAIDFQGPVMKVDVSTPWGLGTFHTHLIGEFNISNLLAVLTTLCLLDVPLEAALHYLSQLQPVAGRMQVIGGGKWPLVVIDYSHKPEALQKALTALRKQCQGELYCVFGCGGDRDKLKRPMMAEISEKIADHIWVTDDNPRNENPEDIVADIMRGFTSPLKVRVEHNRAQSIFSVLQRAKAGDCVLISGKGAERYQLIGNEKIPFNDEEEVKKCLFG